MNKILTLIVALTVATLSAKAQESNAETKHEIAVGIGTYSNSQWIDDLETVTTTLSGVTLGKESYSGPFSVEYFYHPKSWLGVGGVFVYGHHTQDFYLAGLKQGKVNDSYVTLMPAAKFDWLRKRHFGMYSKLAAGFTLRRETAKPFNQNMSDASESAMHFNWQASLLGIEAGSSVLRGFVEVGVGEQGVALAGVRFKF